jgi:hypothetical protein
MARRHSNQRKKLRGAGEPIQGDPVAPPNDIAALCFVCHCFDITEAALSPLTRQKLKRAREEKGISQSEVEEVRQLLWTRILERFRRHKIAPASVTNNFTDEVTSSMLTLYERLRGKLDVGDVPEKEVLWVVVEHVVIPTLFTVMVRFQGLGVGTEFHGADCWYLPKASGRGPRMPVPQVLDYWLRAAGFRTAYGVAHKPRKASARSVTIDEEREFRRWEADKKWVDRCRTGSNLPRLKKLHRLARRFPSSVSWVDDVDSWRARFTLAYALQRTCETADEVFAGIHAAPSAHFAKVFKRLTKTPWWCDDGKQLAAAHTFFATKLLQERLQKSGELDGIMTRVPKHRAASFGLEVADDQIEKWQRETKAAMNPGNWLLAYLCRDGNEDGGSRDPHASAADQVLSEDRLFNLGVEELNRILRLREKGRRKDSRRP